MKRTPMARGRGARTKGSRYENEVVEMAREAGFKDARRNFMSGGAGGGDVVNVPNTHIEAKRQERICIWEWLGQAEASARPTDLPVVVFRRSRSRSYAVLPAADLFGLLQELQELRGAL